MEIESKLNTQFARTMNISSRTPEGEPAHCPLCRSEVHIEPSVLFGDATCPNCGQLLWFVQSAEGKRLFERRSVKDLRQRITDLVAAQLGVSADRIMESDVFRLDLKLDSLDTIELVMEIVEEFDAWENGS